MVAGSGIEGAGPENLVIVLGDGTHIAASLVKPGGPGPFPALLSFYPYRKDDFIGASSAAGRDYFAKAGYATVLVDIRGYGGSGGRAYQAWDSREFDDAAEVVEWTARQPWCNGRTGVWGASYGGAHALGVATRRPPSLCAVASVYGAADIFEDFVYPGGCPNGLGASAWSALVVAKELAPPSLQDPQGRWLDTWRDRLKRLDEGDISSLVWPAHPSYDDYWRDRRIAVEEITAPTFFLSGWRDLLCKGMLDAYERCRSEKRLLAGPWTHAAPDTSTEAPYDWMDELRRWFDRWMTDRPSQTPQPPVIYYVQQAHEWRTATQWPPEGATDLVRWLAPDGALAEAPATSRDVYAGQPLVGVEAGLWYPMGLSLAGVFDQSRDDAKSLTFTSAPCPSAIDITGAPVARLHVEVVGRKEAHLCVKLCDVCPEGRSTLITSGWLRLPSDTQPDEGAQGVEIRLYPTAYRLAAGHSLRLTIACADFPRLWPTPETPTLVVSSDPSAASCIYAPVSDPLAGEATIFHPAAPAAPVIPTPWEVAAQPLCTITRDEAGEGVVVTAGVDMTIGLPQGGTFRLDHSISGAMQAAHPAAASMRTRAAVDLAMPSGEKIRIESNGYATLGRRHLSGRIIADGELIYERRWSTFKGV
jgi:hypothetical protein